MSCAWFFQETPVPGAYENKDFLEDIESRTVTYQFKNEGRKKDPDSQRKGSLLLPGAYERDDLVADLDKKYATYSFKNTTRDSGVSLGVKDKVRYPLRSMFWWFNVDVDGKTVIEVTII